VGILTSVNCSATVAKAIADHFRRDINPQALIDYPNVDGVVALTHSFGCAVDPGGEALAMLRRTLGGYAIHPNFASVLMIGLGCETNQIADLLEAQGLEKVSSCAPLPFKAQAARRKPLPAVSSRLNPCWPRPTASSVSQSAPNT
jgi:altronate dehydratase